MSWRDFAPLASSATNGAGDSTHLASTGEKHTFELDFNGLAHSSPIDMGGLRFSDAGPRTPKGPSLIDARAQ